MLYDNSILTLLIVFYFWKSSTYRYLFSKLLLFTISVSSNLAHNIVDNIFLCVKLEVKKKFKSLNNVVIHDWIGHKLFFLKKNASHLTQKKNPSSSYCVMCSTGLWSSRFCRVDDLNIWLVKFFYWTATWIQFQSHHSQCCCHCNKNFVKSFQYYFFW